MTRFLLLLIAAASLTACQSSEKSTAQAASMGVINDRCPVMNEPVADGVTTDYEGVTIGFCCPGCIDGWKAMSDDDKDAFIAANAGG